MCDPNCTQEQDGGDWHPFTRGLLSFGDDNTSFLASVLLPIRLMF